MEMEIDFDVDVIITSWNRLSIQNKGPLKDKDLLWQCSRVCRDLIITKPQRRSFGLEKQKWIYIYRYSYKERTWINKGIDSHCFRDVYDPPSILYRQFRRSFQKLGPNKNKS